MKTFLLRVLAAPFLALAALLGGIVTLVLGLLLTAAGLVAFLAFLATAFNVLGYAVTRDPNALTAALKTGAAFVAAFSLPVAFGGGMSAFTRRRLARKAVLGVARSPNLRLEVVRDARF